MSNYLQRVYQRGAGQSGPVPLVEVSADAETVTRDDHIDKPDFYSCTQLMRAAESGKLAEVVRLVGLGANVNARMHEGRFIDTHYSGQTALFMAAGRNRHDVVEFLLDHGASHSITNAIGNTPLMQATRKCSVEAIEVLLRKGADVTARNIHGYDVKTYMREGAAGDEDGGYERSRRPQLIAMIEAAFAKRVAPTTPAP